jgi:hypothetical protein
MAIIKEAAMDLGVENLPIEELLQRIEEIKAEREKLRLKMIEND